MENNRAAWTQSFETGYKNIRNTLLDHTSIPPLQHPVLSSAHLGTPDRQKPWPSADVVSEVWYSEIYYLSVERFPLVTMAQVSLYHCHNQVTLCESSPMIPFQ